VSFIILPGERKDDWAFENGKEILWYLENPMTRVVQITAPMAPIPDGFNRHKTNQPKEMDRVFRKLHEQERDKNAQVIEKMWSRGRAHYEDLRCRLNRRLVSADAKEWEKSFIRESLRLMSERDNEAQKNHVYGISAMEESPAPLPGARTRVN
jgi:hypothetical protein